MCECSNANSLSRCVLLIYFFIRQDPKKILSDGHPTLTNVVVGGDNHSSIVRSVVWY